MIPGYRDPKRVRAAIVAAVVCTLAVVGIGSIIVLLVFGALTSDGPADQVQPRAYGAAK